MRDYAMSEYTPNPSKFLGRTAFAAAFYDFLNSLDACILSVCPLCKDCPEFLIGDGTAITMAKAGFNGASIAEESVSPVHIDQPHNRARRQFFSSDVLATPQDRERLMKLAAQVGTMLQALAAQPSPDWLSSTISGPLSQGLSPFNSHASYSLCKRKSRGWTASSARLWQFSLVASPANPLSLAMCRTALLASCVRCCGLGGPADWMQTRWRCWWRRPRYWLGFWMRCGLLGMNSLLAAKFLLGWHLC